MLTRRVILRPGSSRVNAAVRAASGAGDASREPASALPYGCPTDPDKEAEECGSSCWGSPRRSFFAAPTTALAKKGVVFIHGKGGTDLASQSVANAYWGSDMLRATTKGYAVPYLVCHYDGTQYMWVAAGQVAGQITTWMNANAVDEIQVVTHSFGGIVLRWILSNPTYDSRYPRDHQPHPAGQRARPAEPRLRGGEPRGDASPARG